MKYVIGIHPDHFGDGDASSPLWERYLEEAGHTVRQVDVTRADILDQLEGSDGFMWRYAHIPHDLQIARRLLPVLELALGLCVYPDHASGWHFDDKLAQTLLFRAKKLPIPRTWTWFDEAAALEWARSAEYPLVLKLASGAGSTNVTRVTAPEEASRWIRKLFRAGVVRLDRTEDGLLGPAGRAARASVHAVRRGVALEEALADPVQWWPHRGYALFQEFVPGNPFDTRVTVIGSRAFAYRRFNRPDDFRASGSGRFDPDPDSIDPACVRLAFRAARALGTQSAAFDILRRGDDLVLCEVSYAYMSWMVHACPGHWVEADDGLDWREGAMWPERAQIDVFLRQLEARRAG